MIRGSANLRKWDKRLVCPCLSLLGAFPRWRRYRGNEKNVLLVTMTTIGDSLLLGRVLQAFQQFYPEISLTCLLVKGSQLAFDLLDIKRRDILVSGKWKSLAEMLKGKFDLVIDTHQWARGTALLSCLPRSRKRLGFETVGQSKHAAFDETVIHRKDVHEIQNYHALLTHAFPFSYDYNMRAKLSTFTVPQEVFSDSSYVVCHPWSGGFKGTYKQWPDSHWVKLAKALCVRGISVVFSGASGDCEKELYLREQLKGITKVYFRAGVYSLNETLGLISKAKAIVTVNTGIMHLASLVKVPIVVLDGPVSHKRWGPVCDHFTVLEPSSGPKGYIHLGFEYPKIVEYTMDQITVESVLKVIENR